MKTCLALPIDMENGGLFNINGGTYTQHGVVYNGDFGLQGDVGAAEIKHFYTVHFGDYSTSWTVTVAP